VASANGKTVRVIEVEYKRHGTVSLLAGIDLITGKVHACSRRSMGALIIRAGTA
jgi:hypothetical protein